MSLAAALDKAGSSKIPNFQPMMYWSTEATLAFGEGVVEFPAGDKPGTYLVQLAGTLQDGTPIYLETNFTVQIRR